MIPLSNNWMTNHRGWSLTSAVLPDHQLYIEPWDFSRQSLRMHLDTTRSLDYCSGSGSIRTMVIGITQITCWKYATHLKKTSEGSPTLQQFQGMSSMLRNKFLWSLSKSFKPGFTSCFTVLHLIIHIAQTSIGGYQAPGVDGTRTMLLWSCRFIVMQLTIHPSTSEDPFMEKNALKLRVSLPSLPLKIDGWKTILLGIRPKHDHNKDIATMLARLRDLVKGRSHTVALTAGDDLKLRSSVGVSHGKNDIMIDVCRMMMSRYQKWYLW